MASLHEMVKSGKSGRAIVDGVGINYSGGRIRTGLRELNAKRRTEGKNVVGKSGRVLKSSRVSGAGGC